MKYVIIGNGVAGTTAALALRRRDADAEITLVSGESDYFFSRTALMYAYMDRMKLGELEPFERKSYDVQRIVRRRGWVQDLDAAARQLTLAGGAKIPYDRLLLAAGSTPRRASWPGAESVKDGLTHFVTLDDLASCERLTSSAQRAVVAGGGLIGVELVECLRHHGVEVDFLVREPSYWPAALSALEGQVAAEEIERHGVRLRLGEEVAEVLADSATGRLTGVRSSKGEQIPCQMLGVCIGVEPGVTWLRTVQTPPALGRGVQVGADFRTSLPNVWAAGDCAEFQRPDGQPLVEQIWYSAKRQGELAARAMLGDAVTYAPPLFYNSAKFFQLEFTTVGKAVHLPPGATVLEHRVPGRRATVRIAEHHGAVTGFNMLGARWDHRRFETWILERRSLDYVVQHLHEAQFDGEFGRLPLASVRAAWQGMRAA